MPLKPGPSVPMGGMPPDLEAAAASSDAMIGEELGGLLPKPERPFNPRVVSALAEALAKVASVMGVEMMPEPYTGPVPEIPPDEARFLTMIDAAASDYGKPLPVALADIKGDAELTAITAYLTELASDPDFEAFLNEGGEEDKGMEDMGDGESEGPEVEVKIEAGGGEKKGKMAPVKGKPAGDDYFAKRMR